MKKRPKPPPGYDETPELDEGFFAEATPALEDPDLARILAESSTRYRAALREILAAHDAGAPLDDALAKARALIAAE